LVRDDLRAQLGKREYPTCTRKIDFDGFIMKTGKILVSMKIEEK
jgi:hypothetical protein